MFPAHFLTIPAHFLDVANTSKMYHVYNVKYTQIEALLSIRFTKCIKTSQASLIMAVWRKLTKLSHWVFWEIATDSKYSSHCSFLVLDCSHAKYRGPLFHGMDRTGPDRTKFTHYCPEQTGRIRYHVRCSVASHCSGNSGNTFSFTCYSDYVAKTLHNMHTTAKNSIHCQ